MLSMIILYVAGLMTLTPLLLFFAPHRFGKTIFKFEFEGEVAEFLIRDWGAIIAVSAVFLLISAHIPSFRPVILPLSGINKTTYALLVLKNRKKDFAKGMIPSSIMDLIFSLLFLLILLGLIN